MYISVIIVTRNVSVCVKTLHNIMNFNRLCISNGVQVEINFVNDEPFDKMKLIMKKLKTSDRLLFIDYGVCMDSESIIRSVKPFEKGWNGVVFPGVKEGIDWDVFKKKVKAESKEPNYQKGLNFDTVVTTPITGQDNYKIKTTNPKSWVVDCKHVVKCLREKKGGGLALPAKMDELFVKMIDKGVKLYAFIGAHLVINYQHECVGNILQSANVTRDSGVS
jgi:hypothetical protein